MEDDSYGKRPGKITSSRNLFDKADLCRTKYYVGPDLLLFNMAGMLLAQLNNGLFSIAC